MLGVTLIVIGGVLMFVGVAALSAWVSGNSRWFNSGVFGRRGSTKTDRQFLDLYFIGVVLSPLLAGGILIVFGLRQFLWE